jgi:hypothetical protein
MHEICYAKLLHLAGHMSRDRLIQFHAGSVCSAAFERTGMLEVRKLLSESIVHRCFSISRLFALSVV